MMNKKDKFEEFEDQAEDQHPNHEESQYDAVLNKVMGFATRRRLDANQGRLRGLMDCNEVTEDQYNHHPHNS